MVFNYNYFTKAELVAFLNKYGNDFKYVSKPYLIMLEEKQDKVFNELGELSRENNRLLAGIRTLEDKKQFNIHLQLQENHQKWEKLHKKLDEYDKLIAGD